MIITCGAIAAGWINPAQNPEWFTPAPAAVAESAPAKASQGVAGRSPGNPLPSADVFGVAAHPLHHLQAPAAVGTQPTDSFQFAASDFVSRGTQSVHSVLADTPPTPAVSDRAGQLIGSPAAKGDGEEAQQEFQDILALLTA